MPGLQLAGPVGFVVALAIVTVLCWPSENICSMPREPSSWQNVMLGADMPGCRCRLHDADLRSGHFDCDLKPTSMRSLLQLAALGSACQPGPARDSLAGTPLRRRCCARAAVQQERGSSVLQEDVQSHAGAETGGRLLLQPRRHVQSQVLSVLTGHSEHQFHIHR